MEVNIPNHWVKYKLNEIVIYLIGGIWGDTPTNTNSTQNTLAGVIKATDFKEWYKNKASNATLRSINSHAFSLRKLEENDIVIEISGGSDTQPVGRTLLIDKETIETSPYPLTCSNFFRLLRLSKFVFAPFVNYYLNFEYLKGTFNKYQKISTGLRNFQISNFLEEFEIYLPSISEQKRISETINQKLTKNSSLLEDCQSKLAQLKLYKQAKLEEALSNNGNWNEYAIGDISTFIGSGTTPIGGQSNYLKNGIPFIRSQNVLVNKIETQNVVYISEEMHNSMYRTHVESGDVLL
ncbi:MAG: restriction endonuclease subunit S [Bacteroidia bacterium]|nr:restriction endonuclease subunit S [Bacteroidia bacterium]